MKNEKKFVIMQIKDCKVNYLSYYQKGENGVSFRTCRYKRYAKVFADNEVSKAIAEINEVAKAFPMEGQYQVIEIN